MGGEEGEGIGPEKEKDDVEGEGGKSSSSDREVDGRHLRGAQPQRKCRR